MICKARTQCLSQLGHLDQLCFSSLFHGWEECHTCYLTGASISGCATKMLHGQKQVLKPQTKFQSRLHHFFHSRPSVYKIILKEHSS